MGARLWLTLLWHASVQWSIRCTNMLMPVSGLVVFRTTIAEVDLKDGSKKRHPIMLWPTLLWLALMQCSIRFTNTVVPVSWGWSVQNFHGWDGFERWKYETAIPICAEHKGDKLNMTATSVKPRLHFEHGNVSEPDCSLTVAMWASQIVPWTWQC